MPKKESDETRLAVMETKLTTVIENGEKTDKKIDGLSAKLDSGFVSQVEFEPIKKIVYGMVTLVLVSVLGAVIALVIRK